MKIKETLGIFLIVCTAIGSLYGGFTYAAGLVAQVQSNTEAILLQKWQYLETKRIKEGLTPSEKFQYCNISRQLGYKGEGCAS
tara:strand:+ start:522 stop:770 length:249 start_codon:yes stop_codon:yes gene_type:complete